MRRSIPVLLIMTRQGYFLSQFSPTVDAESSFERRGATEGDGDRRNGRSCAGIASRGQEQGRRGRGRPRAIMAVGSVVGVDGCSCRIQDLLIGSYHSERGS